MARRGETTRGEVTRGEVTQRPSPLYRPMLARDVAEHHRASTPMELLFEDIRQTLGASDVALPVLFESLRSSEEGDNMEAAVARMTLDESGGVALPCSPSKKSRLGQERASYMRHAAPLWTAG